MGVFSRRGRDQLTIFFATDIHGSEICFKKFLAAPEFYGAGVAMLGGDMTGKMVVPVVDEGNGRHRANIAGKDVLVSAGDELSRLEDQIRNTGFYPYRTDPDDMARLGSAPEEVERIFHEQMETTLRRWGDLADRKFAGTDSVIYVAPGNDDPYFIDDVLRELPRFQVVEGEVVEIAAGYEMLATGYSNKTPWETHREVEEDELRERVAKMAAQIQNMDRAIFNIHVPPYDSTIDEGPDINPETWEQKMVLGRSITKPVGSHAVRAVIDEYQPLLALHGHIHESRGVVRLGNTLAINPGSDYGDSVLRGAIVNIQDGKVAGHQLTAG